MKDRPEGIPVGIITMPLHPRTRVPLTDWPKTKDEENIAWRLGLQRHPDPSLGIVTGASGLLVLDLDRKNGKDGLKVILDFLMEKMGKEDARIQITKHPHCCRTKSGGFHLHFKLPDGFHGKTTTRNGEKGIDTRGIGGMVVAPPTPGYTWLREGWDRIPECPGWLVAWLEANQKTGENTGAGAPTCPPVGSSPWESMDAPDGGTVLQAADGTAGTARTLLVGNPKMEKIPVYCPVHNDKTPSAVIFRPHGRGKIRLWCSCCGRFWPLGRLETRNRG